MDRSGEARNDNFAPVAGSDEGSTLTGVPKSIEHARTRRNSGCVQGVIDSCLKLVLLE
jgi:hypothetical protein